LICGIDPGAKGGIAFLGLTMLITYPMGEAWELVNILELHAPAHVFVEKARPMPSQGVTSMFTFGRGYGEILGILIALKIPHTLVIPRTWQKVMHLGIGGDQPKVKSEIASRQTWPCHNWLGSPRCRKAHDGMIDAALIAEYGRRSLPLTP